MHLFQFWEVIRKISFKSRLNLIIVYDICGDQNTANYFNNNYSAIYIQEMI